MRIIRQISRSTAADLGAAGFRDKLFPGGAMAEPVETIEVEQKHVACDGGNGPLGHPRVYLNMGNDRSIDCPYCGRRYVLKEGAAAGTH